MQILDGKKASAEIKEELRLEVEKVKKTGGKIPHLAAVLVGQNGASVTYVNAKSKACDACGFESSTIHFDSSITEEGLLHEIEKLNEDDRIDGFIIQLPLPDHINKDRVLQAISPGKDVDGFHPENVGRMVLNLPTFLPATPYGIMMLLERNGIKTKGKHCVVVGRSNIVGGPMSILFNRPGDATVTLTHRYTENLEIYTRMADILVVAVGIPGFIKADMVKDGVVVVDVGITRVEDDTKKNGFKLLGDVDFDEVSKKASWITPVPGGVGPMTITGLMKNTFFAAQQRNVSKVSVS